MMRVKILQGKMGVIRSQFQETPSEELFQLVSAFLNVALARICSLDFRHFFLMGTVTRRGSLWVKIGFQLLEGRLEFFHERRTYCRSPKAILSTIMNAEAFQLTASRDYAYLGEATVDDWAAQGIFSRSSAQSKQ